MSSSESDFLTQLNELIDENMDKSSFSIEFLCAELGVSRTNLHRKIKKEKELSTSLYIRKRRIQKARELIKTTDLNFSEIAYATGINNPQNFSKYFNEEFNLSPTEYRQSLEANLSPQIDEAVDDNISNQKGTLQKLPINQLLSLAIILIVVIAGWMYNKSSDSKPESEQPTLTKSDNSIAVLPFAVLNPNGNTFFSDGITEDILSNLARLPGLKVISRTSSMQYRNTNKPLRQIAGELGVNYILEGSVREAENKVKISVQLINANEDSHIWAQDYNRELKDIFQIQADVSKEIALALKQNLSKDLEERFETPSTSDFNAYNAFVVGRQLIHSRTENGLREGLAKMNEALKFDPNFADALSFKALAYNLLGNLHYSNRSNSYEKGLDAVDKTLILDPQNDLAYLVRAGISHDQHKWQESIHAFEKVFEINPNNALAFYWYSLLLREVGELEKAAQYSQKAADLDPLLPVITAGHIKNCCYIGEFDQANLYLERSKSLFGETFFYPWAKAIIQRYQKDYESAVVNYNIALSINPELKSLLKEKYYSLGKLGKEQEVIEFLKRYQVIEGGDYIVLASVACGINDKEVCMKYLNKAEKDGYLPDDIYVDPIFDPIREMPRFNEIIKKYQFEGPFIIL